MRGLSDETFPRVRRVQSANASQGPVVDAREVAVDSIASGRPQKVKELEEHQATPTFVSARLLDLPHQLIQRT